VLAGPLVAVVALLSSVAVAVPLAPAADASGGATLSIPVTCIVGTDTTLSAPLVATVQAPHTVAPGQSYMVKLSATLPDFSPVPFLVTALTQTSTWELAGEISPFGAHTLVQGPTDYPEGSTVVAQTFSRRVQATGVSGDVNDFVFAGFSYTFKDLPAGPVIPASCTLDNGPTKVAEVAIH
jgi:hypothetical protein